MFVYALAPLRAHAAQLNALAQPRGRGRPLNANDRDMLAILCTLGECAAAAAAAPRRIFAINFWRIYSNRNAIISNALSRR